MHGQVILVNRKYTFQFVDNVNKSTEKYRFKLKILCFEFHCDRNLRKYRDMKSETREHCLNIGDSKSSAAKAKRNVDRKKVPFCCWYCKQNKQFPVADVDCMKEYRVRDSDNGTEIRTFKIDTSNISINESIESIIKDVSCL